MASSNKKDENTALKRPDIYRDTALRYLGYTGSLGWFCRAFLPFQVASMVSVAYVCADIFDKANESAKRGESENQMLKRAADAFTWQFFATFALPGVVMHSINGIASKFQPRRRTRFFILPCVLSGVALPFISKPIDDKVNHVMQSYLRSKRFDEGIKECVCDDKVEVEIESGDEDLKTNKYDWFFEQSRDQHDLELERYREKLKAQRSQGPPSSPAGGGTAAMRPSPPSRAQEPANRVPIDDFNRRRFGNEALAPEPPDAAMRSPRLEQPPRGYGAEALAPELPDAEEPMNRADTRDAGPSQVQPGSSAGANNGDEDGLIDKAIQVDKTTKPPGPPKPPKSEPPV